MSMCRGGKREEEDELQAIQQNPECDWTLVHYQGNYPFIQTE